MEDSRLEERKRNFMKGKQPHLLLLGPKTDLVRERESWTVHLRKKKNLDRINRKRTTLLTGAEFAERKVEVEKYDPSLLDETKPFVSPRFSLSLSVQTKKLTELCERAVQEQEYDNVVSAIRAVRFLGSKEAASEGEDLNQTPLFSTGFVDKIVSYLQYRDYPDLAYECLWVLTNACMGCNGEVEKMLSTTNLLEMANYLIATPIEHQTEELINKHC